MPILNPTHLLEQAETLVEAPPAGPPRQVDRRRAVSSAYNALFHFVLTALADEYVGAAHRATGRYALMHRSIDHRSNRDLCRIASKQKATAKDLPFVSSTGFGPDLANFACAFIDLHGQPHSAGYDVSARYRTADVRRTIAAARIAIRDFEAADPDGRRPFLTLLLCPPR